MRVADSHEFLELYRGDKDVRMGMEMIKLRDDLEFASFAPDKLSPTDRDRFHAVKLAEVGWPDIPERMELRLLPSASLRFAHKESGGIVSFMLSYSTQLRGWSPDVVIESTYSWLTPRSYQTWRVCKSMGIPLVYYDPGDDIPIGTKHRIMSLWESSVLGDVSAIITFNDAGARRFIDKYGYQADRIHVIPKPVDVTRFRSAAPARQKIRAELGLEDHHLAIGYLGRLVKYKGSGHLLSAAKAALDDPSLERTRFVFVGGSLASDEDESEYSLPNTRVTGMVPNAKVPEILAALDVLVFPDLTRPGAFPTAIAEGMAAGKALVVGVGASTRFLPLRNDRDALFVEPSSTTEILRALRRLASDANLVGRLGSAVAALASRRMDYPVVAAAWLRVIENASAAGAR